MFFFIEDKRKMNPAAVEEDGTVLTYGELTGFCREMAQVVPERSLVFSLCRNDSGSLAGYVSFLSGRIVPLLLSSTLDKSLYDELVGIYDPDYIWVSDIHEEAFPGRAKLVKEALSKSDTYDNKKKAAIQDREKSATVSNGEKSGAAPDDKKDIDKIISDIPLETKWGEVVFRRYGYALIRRKPEDEIKRLVREPDKSELANGVRPRLHPELALLLTTSGSTGSPKLVRQTYTNVYVNAAAIADYLELDVYERPITSLPMHYTYGLSVINSHLLVGAKILMTETSYAQKGFWEFAKKEVATSIAGVPFTYEMLKKLRFFKMNLPHLRTLTQAGGKLSEELHKEFAQYAKKNNKRFIVMYGQTEATARMSYLPFIHSLEKCGSIGIAIPGGIFALYDDEGNEIDKPGVTGELVYKGQNVTYGYAEKLSDLADGDDLKGELMTGDLAYVDEDGYYYIVGRKKRFLKIYGNRVNLDECERMIESYIGGTECACVGEDDHMRIYLTDDNKSDGVKSFITEKTGLNPQAFEIKIIEKIPMNDAGKKMHGELE